MKLNPRDRAFLFGTVLLSAYQIVVGINDLSAGPILAYSVAFGVLLVAALMLIILGLDGLDSPVVSVVSTIIPLALATGLVWQYLPALRTAMLSSPWPVLPPSP